MNNKECIGIGSLVRITFKDDSSQKSYYMNKPILCNVRNIRFDVSESGDVLDIYLIAEYAENVERESDLFDSMEGDFIPLSSVQKLEYIEQKTIFDLIFSANIDLDSFSEEDAMTLYRYINLTERDKGKVDNLVNTLILNNPPDFSTYEALLDNFNKEEEKSKEADRFFEALDNLRNEPDETTGDELITIKEAVLLIKGVKESFLRKLIKEDKIEHSRDPKSLRRIVINKQSLLDYFNSNPISCKKAHKRGRKRKLDNK